MRPRRDRTVLHALAETAIRFYQRHLSPRKGYRCSYAAAFDAPSCSAFGLELLRQHSLDRAWRELQDRFAACAMATKARKDRERDPLDKEPLRARRRFLSNSTDAEGCHPMNWCDADDFGRMGTDACFKYGCR